MAKQTSETRSGLPDLRLPVGLFFIVAAVILLAQWLIGGTPTSMPAVAANADRDWGFVLLGFGLLMAYFGWRAGPQPTEEGGPDA